MCAYLENPPWNRPKGCEMLLNALGAFWVELDLKILA